MRFPEIYQEKSSEGRGKIICYQHSIHLNVCVEVHFNTYDEAAAAAAA